MIKTYRKTALTKACQWNGNNLAEIENFVGKDNAYIKNGKLYIVSLEGPLPTKLGDYVMLDIDNNPYCCDYDVFKKAYVEVI